MNCSPPAAIPSEVMAKWTRRFKKRPFTGIGANDAHQNQIFKETRSTRTK